MGEAPEEDCRQLWRRLVFNVLVSNTDDHLRNHAFLRGERGWPLSPAYDVNPTPADVGGGMHALALNDVDRAGSLEIALSVGDYFGIKLSEARTIACEVASSVSGWEATAKKFGIKDDEIDRMSSAFRRDDLELAQSFKHVLPIQGTAPVAKPRKKNHPSRKPAENTSASARRAPPKRRRGSG